LGKQGWDKSLAVTMHFNSDWLMILSFKTHKEHGLEMLNWTGQHVPNLIMWLEVESKVGTESTRDCCTEIRVRSDSIGSSLEESLKVVETWTRRKHQHFDAVKTPDKTVPHHIQKWRETAVISDGGWINTISKGGKHQ
jgi:hypothetical protein